MSFIIPQNVFVFSLGHSLMTSIVISLPPLPTTLSTTILSLLNALSFFAVKLKQGEITVFLSSASSTPKTLPSSTFAVIPKIAFLIFLSLTLSIRLKKTVDIYYAPDEVYKGMGSLGFALKFN